MAVQAQYPSNVLLLNSKNGQEGHQYSLQQSQQQGELIDQSNMIFFNNGGIISRKRARESTTTPNTINPYSFQSESPQFIDLTQLHNHHHHQNQNTVSTGLGLSFGQQQQQHEYQSSHFLSLMSQGIASQIKQQRDEIDQILQSQAEELRRGLTEKRQKHYQAILKATNETVSRRLKEKEIEIEKATRRNRELEARAAELKVEAQVWQTKAKSQEIAALSLQAQLQQAMMMNNISGEDGLTCAVGFEGQAEDAESAYVDPERVVGSGPKCRGCGKRVASVVLLPCRHLCVCSQCDPLFRACPVCLTVKNSTVEVFLS